jgi:hypothetical protein
MIKTIPVMALAIAFAIGSVMMLPALAHLSWQDILTDTITSKNANTQTLTITTPAPVPKQTGELVGFGWLYVAGSPDSAFGITTHNVGNANGDASEPPNDVRDSTQNPDGWHGHNFDFGATVGPGTICVAAIVDSPNVGISIKGSQIDVQVRNSVLTGTLSDIAAVYDIIVSGACPVTAGTESTTAGPLRLAIVVHDLN